MKTIILLILISTAMSLRIEPEKDEAFDLNVSTMSMTADKLKTTIAAQLKYPVNLLRLMFRDTFEMPGDMLLSDFGLNDLSKIAVKQDYLVAYWLGMKPYDIAVPRTGNIRSLTSRVIKKHPELKEAQALSAFRMLATPVSDLTELSSLIEPRNDPIFSGAEVLLLVPTIRIWYQSSKGKFSQMLSPMTPIGMGLEENNINPKLSFICSDLECKEKNYEANIPLLITDIISETTLYIKEDIVACSYEVIFLDRVEKKTVCSRGATLNEVGSSIIANSIHIRGPLRFTVDGQVYSTESEEYKSVGIEGKKIIISINYYAEIDGLPDGKILELDSNEPFTLASIRNEIDKIYDMDFYVLSLATIRAGERILKSITVFEKVLELTFSNILKLRVRKDLDHEITLYFPGGALGVGATSLDLSFPKITAGMIRGFMSMQISSDGEKSKEPYLRIWLQESPLKHIELTDQDDSALIKDIYNYKWDKGFNFADLQIYAHADLDLTISSTSRSNPTKQITFPFDGNFNSDLVKGYVKEIYGESVNLDYLNNAVLRVKSYKIDFSFPLSLYGVRNKDTLYLGRSRANIQVEELIYVADEQIFSESKIYDSENLVSEKINEVRNKINEYALARKKEAGDVNLFVDGIAIKHITKEMSNVSFAYTPIGQQSKVKWVINLKDPEV